MQKRGRSWYKGGLNAQLLSLGFVLFIIVLLALSAPAIAVNVGFSDMPAEADAERPISFVSYVDFHYSEQVPVRNLSLSITGPGVSIHCIFRPNGAPLAGCAGISVMPINNVGYGNGTMMFGYDYVTDENITYYYAGYGYGYKHTTGYGHDVPPDGGPTAIYPELAYNITWTPPREGAYSLTISAYASDGVNSHTYSSTHDLDVNPPVVILSRFNARARGDESHLKRLYNDAVFTNSKLGATVTVWSNDPGESGGSIVVNIRGEPVDAISKPFAVATFNLKPNESESFVAGNISMSGSGKATYSRHTRGTWSDSKWLGLSPVINIKEDVDFIMTSDGSSKMTVTAIKNGTEVLRVEDIPFETSHMFIRKILAKRKYNNIIDCNRYCHVNTFRCEC